MSKRAPTYDVFVSHARADLGLAKRVAGALESAGLAVFRSGKLATGERYGDAARDALAESRTVIVIVSPVSRQSHAVAFEVGAAIAWQKAVYGLLAARGVEVPQYLAETKVFSLSELQKLVNEVKDAAAPLTAEQIASLSELYRIVGVPSEQLARRPKDLERLTRRFNLRASASVPPERLLQELIRLRKKGLLRTSRVRRTEMKRGTKDRDIE